MYDTHLDIKPNIKQNIWMRVIYTTFIKQTL